MENTFRTIHRDRNLIVTYSVLESRFKENRIDPGGIEKIKIEQVEYAGDIITSMLDAVEEIEIENLCIENYYQGGRQ